MYLGTLLVPVLGDLVDAVAWGSKIYTLRGGVDGCEQMCALHAVFVLCVCLRERLIRWGGWGSIGKFWGIVPCIYKIYTLGRFHDLLETFLFAVD
jgi:hypothetical protein